MATTSHAELAERIEDLVLAHIAESRRVAAEAVERAFTQGGSSRRTRAPSKQSSFKHARRDPGEVAALAERLFAAVCAHPSEGMSMLAQEVGSTPRKLHRPMANLKRAGRVRSVGQKNLTRYFPLAKAAT